MTASSPSDTRGEAGRTHRPALFIGSSEEGLPFARAARFLLNDDADITIWNEGFFQLGGTFIETLVNELERFDFALLVITPDDFVRARDVEGFGPRDNVLFELGLFMGRLGRARTFLLHQSSSIKIPTDLSGMKAAKYNWPTDDDNRRKAIAAACDMIRDVMRDLGVNEAKIGAKIGRDLSQLESRQNIHEQELSRQRAEIRALQVALQGMVTRYEYEKLTGLRRERPFLVRYSDNMKDELRHLRAMDMIMNTPDKGIRSIEQRYAGSQEKFDLGEYFHITEHGLEYLDLRDQIATDDSDT
jgi:predicted nucleotide-binding protein